MRCGECVDPSWLIFPFRGECCMISKYTTSVCACVRCDLWRTSLFQELLIAMESIENSL